MRSIVDDRRIGTNESFQHRCQITLTTITGTGRQSFATLCRDLARMKACVGRREDATAKHSIQSHHSVHLHINGREVGSAREGGIPLPHTVLVGDRD